MSRSWANGSTRQWRRTRTTVLQRDNHQCQLRLPGCTTTATHAHHVLGKTNGDNPDHLIAACQHCNLKIGDPLKHDPPPRQVTQW